MADDLIEHVPGMVETPGDITSWAADKGGELKRHGMAAPFASAEY